MDLPCFIDEDNLQRIHIVGKNIHNDRRIEKYFKNHEKIELKNMNEISDGLDRLRRNEEVKNFEDYTSCCVQVLSPSKYFYDFYYYYLMMISSKYAYLKIVKSLIPLMYMYKPNAPNPMLSFKTGELEWKSPVENVSLNSLYRHRPGTRQVLENTKTILKVFKTEEIEWMSTPLANAALNGHLEVIK